MQTGRQEEVEVWWGGSTNRMSDSRCSSQPDLLSSLWSLQNPPSTVTFHFAEGESAPSAHRRTNYEKKKNSTKVALLLHAGTDSRRLVGPSAPVGCNLKLAATK